MDPSRRRGPYVVAAAKMMEQSNRNAYKTTYTESFHDAKDNSNFMAYKDSFLRHNINPAEDLSPYPMAKDNTEPVYRKPYLVTSELEKIKHDRKHFEEDDYPDQGNFHNRAHSREPGYQQYDHRDGMQSYNREPSPEKMRTPLYEGHEPRNQHGYDPSQNQVVCCDRCYDKTKKKCLNKMLCNHLYCDDCILSIPVQDPQFRNSLCYCCELCHNITPDRKTVRLDPDGNALESYEAMKWFANGGVRSEYDS